jgi:uncharacterized membrane protein
MGGTMNLEGTAQFKLHWHVFLTHFPLSLLGVAFLFQVLHLYRYPQCFEMASTVVLVAGVAALFPTTLTGYFTWKRQYNGAKASIFRRKIMIAVALLLIGVPLCVWRIIIGPSPEASRPRIHWAYFIGTSLMIVGAVLEGYFGGRLSHRPRIQFQKHGDTG